MELSIANVTRARNQVDDVEWSAEDGTRSEMDFLCRIVEAVIKAGATTVNIPDTVGYTVPEEYTRFMRTLIERVPNSDKAIFSVHCHNDLGMAVANSLAGIAGGARQIECTVNGIGERAGNAALEEVVMAINVRNDVFPWWNKIDTTMLTRASKLVSAATSFPVQFNKAIVGRNAQRREYALDAFMKHGYFDDATRDLRIADSANERSAAARRLSFVHNQEATPHLVGALDDPSPDVRRAAVEALMDLRDPAAIGPLNSLMKTENDRKVPRTLIKHAIDACATVPPAETTPVAVSNISRATIPGPSSQPIETEREVIEL
jgi:2-isopropylmalate synthase